MKKSVKEFIIICMTSLAILILFMPNKEPTISEQTWEQFQPTLLQQDNTSIRKYNRLILKYLKRPNPFYQVSDNNKTYSQSHQDETVYDILQINDGFFIEMGALDGVYLSNTLWLERKHNWTGLLVEANPQLCQKIDKAKRAAWRLCACISNKNSITFVGGESVNLGGEKETLHKDVQQMFKRSKEVKVPCFTLLDILNAINHLHIDYFSLDIEGGELAFLNQIKNDLKSKRIVINIWSIEYRIFNGHRNLYPESKAKLEEIRSYFKDVGGYTEYCQLGSRNKTDGYSLDVLFARNEILCKKNRTILPSGKYVDCT